MPSEATTYQVSLLLSVPEAPPITCSSEMKRRLSLWKSTGRLFTFAMAVRGLRSNRQSSDIRRRHLRNKKKRVNAQHNSDSDGAGAGSPPAPELDAVQLWETYGVFFGCMRTGGNSAVTRLCRRLGIVHNNRTSEKREGLRQHADVYYSENYVKVSAGKGVVYIAWLTPDEPNGPAVFVYYNAHVYFIQDVLAGAVPAVAGSEKAQETLMNTVQGACESNPSLDNALDAYLQQLQQEASQPLEEADATAELPETSEADNAADGEVSDPSEEDLQFSEMELSLPNPHANLCNDLLGPEDNPRYIAWLNGHMMRAEDEGEYDEEAMDALELGPSNLKQMIFAELWQREYVEEVTDYAKAGIAFDYNGAMTTTTGNWRFRGGSGGRAYNFFGNQGSEESSSMQNGGNYNLTGDNGNQQESEGDASETESELSVELPEYPVGMELLERDILYDKPFVESEIRRWMLERVFDAEGEHMYARDPETDEVKPRTEVETDVRLTTPEGQEITGSEEADRGDTNARTPQAMEKPLSQEKAEQVPWVPYSEKINYSPTDYVVNEPLTDYELDPPAQPSAEEPPLEAFVPAPPPEPQGPPLPSNVPIDRDSYHLVRTENYDYYIRRAEGLRLDLSCMYAVERVERPSMPTLPDQYTGDWKDVSLEGMSVAPYREIPDINERMEDEMSNMYDREFIDDVLPYNFYKVTNRVYLIRANNDPDYVYTEEHGWLESSGATDRDLNFNEIVVLDGYEAKAEKCEVEGDTEDPYAVLEIRDGKLKMMPQIIMNYPLAYANMLNEERGDTGSDDATFAEDFMLETSDESDEEFESPESEL